MGGDQSSAKAAAVGWQALAGGPAEVTRRASQRVLRILALQGLSKASRELSSDDLHEVNVATLQKLKQLLPIAPPQVALPIYEQCTCTDLDDTEEGTDLLLRIVSEFPVSSAAGPSQLGPTHFREAVFCGSDLAQHACTLALLLFVNACASGKLPPVWPNS